MSGVDSFTTPAWSLLCGLLHHPVDENRSLRAGAHWPLVMNSAFIDCTGSEKYQSFNTGT